MNSVSSVSTTAISSNDINCPNPSDGYSALPASNNGLCNGHLLKNQLPNRGENSSFGQTFQELLSVMNQLLSFVGNLLKSTTKSSLPESTPACSLPSASSNSANSNAAVPPGATTVIPAIISGASTSGSASVSSPATSDTSPSTTVSTTTTDTAATTKSSATRAGETPLRNSDKASSDDVRTALMDMLKKFASQLKEKFGIDLDLSKLIPGLSDAKTTDDSKAAKDKAKAESKAAARKRKMKAFMQKIRDRLKDAVNG